jgi:hypothetical protein
MPTCTVANWLTLSLSFLNSEDPEHEYTVHCEGERGDSEQKRRRKYEWRRERVTKETEKGSEDASDPLASHLDRLGVAIEVLVRYRDVVAQLDERVAEVDASDAARKEKSRQLTTFGGGRAVVKAHLGCAIDHPASSAT